MLYKKREEESNQLKNFFLIILPPVIILILWQILSNHGVINKAILPPPTKVVNTLIAQFQNGQLPENVVASAGRIIRGFFIGTFCGLVIGILMGLFPKFDKAMTAIVGVFRPIPMIALIPFFILWLGIAEESKIAVITLGTFWPVLINTSQGMKSADEKLLELSRSLRKSYFEVLFQIILPSALPFIGSGVRLAAGQALVCVVTSEMIAASSGVGYMIMFARELSKADLMLVGVFTIGVFGFIIDFIFLKIQKKLMN